MRAQLCRNATKPRQLAMAEVDWGKCPSSYDRTRNDYPGRCLLMDDQIGANP